ncbi:hypothetical protein PF005_g23906 [Phytophthora fragariae]|uniref:RxLR effector protein n=1 Tax=Phytophthora fragariae TaxID=53985 RepID=A0A6A3V9E8_9STRA|nr:hypothetical protein PF003_g27514 [Phytophthora fragariae]KAE8917476.1 hypothetical protein PF009_g32201 [Phytophthora fragariae]KAE9057433.1 hypothetical protein PF007_g31647 [Phytophthora fragariae]KAE9163469.1 hypothetical protein PF002_g31855 [Phytophthora fragariae]KAE9178864.1 hypothetical protein PF005_g23906 [Phytophthora fragariae]
MRRNCWLSVPPLLLLILGDNGTRCVALLARSLRQHRAALGPAAGGWFSCTVP